MTTQGRKTATNTSDAVRTTRNALRHFSGAAFTLIEMLAAMAILAIMIVLLFAAFSQASRAWLQGENRVETFTQARAALDFMTKELSQVIVTTNVTFLANTNSLAFIAPVNDSPSNAVDLVEIVYRLQNPTLPMTKPTQLLRRLTRYGSGTWDFYGNPTQWPATFDTSLTNVLADNVVSLGFEFVDTAAPANHFVYWNSSGDGNAWTEVGGLHLTGAWQNMTNRAPAGVYITLGVIDSRAAQRFNAVAGADMTVNPGKAIVVQATQYFTTFVAIPNRQP